jgi:hypothetical protein
MRPVARRDDREYREYLREEQRSQAGCSAGRMQPDFHHGLLGHLTKPRLNLLVLVTTWVTGSDSQGEALRRQRPARSARQRDPADPKISVRVTIYGGSGFVPSSNRTVKIAATLLIPTTSRDFALAPTGGTACEQLVESSRSVLFGPKESVPCLHGVLPSITGG